MAVKEAVILAALLAIVLSQNPNCDYRQAVQVGQTYYVYSPNYPYNYSAGAQCRWIATCPSGYNCVLDCPEIALPDSTQCSLDRFLVSRSGDPQLSGAETYCGRGSLTAVSTAQTISVGLISSYSSPGGRFMCTLTARAVGTNPAACSCGYKKSNRIVGGQETGVNEFPMMAGLVSARTSQIFCGGVIISNLYILTAAHCLINQNASELAVVVGEHDVTVGDSPATEAIRVASVTPHPFFTQSNYDYDIAILRLQRSITFSDRVGPVCLPFKFVNTNFTGASVTVLGWGTLFPGGPTSNVLRKVDLNVISQAQCQATVPSLTNRQFCTYSAGKDACQFDSGGPALYTDPQTSLLFNLGLVSYGRFCATQGQPGINTRVAWLLDWIVANTPGASYCRK